MSYTDRDHKPQRHPIPMIASPWREIIQSMVARGGTLPLRSSLAPGIPRFFVRGGRRARRSIPGPPAPAETTTAGAVEWCTANAPAAYADPPLLVPQGDHGIDSHRPPRGNV